MSLSKCPDCDSYLGHNLMRCVCGWEKPGAGAYQVAGEPRPVCRTVGCSQPAMNGFWYCRPCEERIRHEQAEAACRAKGLVTTDQKRAYVRGLMRSFGRGGGFERWCQTVTQQSIDTIVRMGGRDDEKLLERFRDAGVIDGRNVLIPAGEPRRIAADAARAERARQIAKMQDDLKRLAEKFGPLDVPAIEPEVKA